MAQESSVDPFSVQVVEAIFNSETERIIRVYDDIASASGIDVLPLLVLNAASRPFAKPSADALIEQHIVRKSDKYGCLVGEQTVDLPATRLPVAVGGSLEIRTERASLAK